MDELRYLLEHVGNGPEYQNISGPERAMLCRTAAETGLRANELRTLTRGSLALGTAGPGGPFPLAASGPTIRVGAAYSKRRREDVVPLRPDTAAALAAFVATKAPAAAVFKMPPPCGLVKMLKADLESAREAWVNGAPSDRDRLARRESEFLVYRDREGRVADFHAFRHTFITNLITAGVHPHTAQNLARHSTITLTMDRYGHLLRGAETDALAALPDLSMPWATVQRAG